MMPEKFVAKWSKNQQKETAVSQSNSNDICRLINHLTPLECDKRGAAFCFKTQTTLLNTYGWPHILTNDQILEKLLELNLERTIIPKNEA